MGIDKIL